MRWKNDSKKEYKKTDPAGGLDRHREEVINIVLAETLLRFGVRASPETLKSGGKERPDVIFAYRGLRCVIKGKYEDVSGAHSIVTAQTEKRIATGIARIGISVVYPPALRSTQFHKLYSVLTDQELMFQISTETGSGEWKTGTV